MGIQLGCGVRDGLAEQNGGLVEQPRLKVVAEVGGGGRLVGWPADVELLSPHLPRAGVGGEPEDRGDVGRAEPFTSGGQPFGAGGVPADDGQRLVDGGGHRAPAVSRTWTAASPSSCTAASFPPNPPGLLSDQSQTAPYARPGAWTTTPSARATARNASLARAQRGSSWGASARV